MGNRKTERQKMGERWGVHKEGQEDGEQQGGEAVQSVTERRKRETSGGKEVVVQGLSRQKMFFFWFHLTRKMVLMQIAKLRKSDFMSF